MLPVPRHPEARGRRGRRPLASGQRTLGHGTVHSSFHFHCARLIEILLGLERMQQLLAGDRILDPHVRAHADAAGAEVDRIVRDP